MRVALVLQLTDHFDREVARGIIQFAKRRSDWTLFGHGWMFSPLEDLDSWVGDGIIARVARREDAERLAARGIPLVDVAGAFTEQGFISVANDDQETGRIVGEYFRRRGLQTWAYCGVDGVHWSQERLIGFKSGVETDHVSVFERSLDWWEQAGTTGHLSEFLKSIPTPGGLFAANDSVALRVLNACRSKGVQVPTDLAVVGVDNEDIVCDLTDPSLSSVSLNVQGIGYAAAAALEERLLANDRGSEGRHIGPDHLVERASSRIYPTADPVVRKALESIHRLAPSGATVGEIAGALPLSRRSLEIRVKRETGKTLHESLTRARVEHAKLLLRSTDQKIESIARASGFGSLQRFFEVFRRATSMTPGRYRDGYRKSHSGIVTFYGAR